MTSSPGRKRPSHESRNILHLQPEPNFTPTREFLDRLDREGLFIPPQYPLTNIWYDEVPAPVAIAPLVATDTPVTFTVEDKRVIRALTDEYIAVHQLGNEARRIGADNQVSIDGLSAAAKQHAHELAAAAKTIDVLLGTIEKQNQALKALGERLEELARDTRITLEGNSDALLRTIDRVDLIDSELALKRRDEEAKARRGKKAVAA